ncbi:MAG: acyltransferase domain-containing protein, partial [Gammaproteobacteria bacterium]|nr:acyltransferase domain-containing protein [Gammaproteobacteria bacterium]
HEAVCSVPATSRTARDNDASVERAADITFPADTHGNNRTPSNVAIIGIGLLFPQANSPQDFWNNILTKTNAITEVPASRWDWRVYYDPDQSRRDRIVSKWGCFLDDVVLNPMDFGIPPKAVPSIEPSQLLTLEAVRRALIDAGYLIDEKKLSPDLDHENTAIILGMTGGLGELGQCYTTRAEMTRRIPRPTPELFAGLPEWTEDSFPGILPNVSAGRVSKHFDFGGANFTVDSACASSLTAIDLAVRELETGRCNVAITGGVDTLQSPFAYLCFSKTQALSPRGRIATFDATADGTLLGEGVAILVLKRLSDAQRDGDRVYAVIKATASASDGRGFGLTAPSSTGQRRVFDRAYAKAIFTPDTLGFYEAHGTGTVAGDETELKTITDTLLANNAAPGSCALGAVKALIGHTKSTAGVAGLVKAALSLHYRTLAPQPNIEEPIGGLRDPEAPVYLLDEPKPWLQTSPHPRRAGVSAFGFGGANCHCVLEEYPAEPRYVAVGAERWPCEFIPIVAPDRDALAREITRLEARLMAHPNPDTPLRLQDVAYSHAMSARTAPARGARLGLVVESLQQLTDAVALVKRFLSGEVVGQLPPFIQLALDDVADGAEKSESPAVKSCTFLFPGQGAQYPGMGREVALYFQEMRAALEFSDRQFQDDFPKPLTQYLFPTDTWSESARDGARRALTATQVAQPAIGAVEMGYLSILNRLGVSADRVAGLSYGEYAALFAAGVFSPSAFLRLSLVRGQAMAQACEISDGAMAAVNATREEVEKHLSKEQGVVLANHNGPRQIAISGERAAVEKVVTAFQEAGIDAVRLPVAGAFHSGLMAAASGPLDEALAATDIMPPAIPVYGNADGLAYPDTVAAIRTRLSEHLLSSVEFCRQIEVMYEAGSRLFVEVGPRRILSGLVTGILGDRPHVMVSLDGNGGGLRGLLIAMATLFAQGIALDYGALFAHRACGPMDSPSLSGGKTPPKSHTLDWLVNGSRAVPVNSPVDTTITPTNNALINNISGEDRRQAAANNTFPDNSSDSDISIRDLPMNNEQQSPSRSEALLGRKEATSPGRQLAPDTALAAYQAYQETMRRFLALEERVISLFFGASVPEQTRSDSAGGDGRYSADTCSEMRSLRGAARESVASFLPDTPHQGQA